MTGEWRLQVRYVGVGPNSGVWQFAKEDRGFPISDDLRDQRTAEREMARLVKIAPQFRPVEADWHARVVRVVDGVISEVARYQPEPTQVVADSGLPKAPRIWGAGGTTSLDAPTFVEPEPEPTSVPPPEEAEAPEDEAPNPQGKSPPPRKRSKRKKKDAVLVTDDEDLFTE